MLTYDDADQMLVASRYLAIARGFLEHGLPCTGSGYDRLRCIDREYVLKSSILALPVWLFVEGIIDKTGQNSSIEHYLCPQYFCQNQLLVLTLCQNARPPPSSILLN